MIYMSNIRSEIDISSLVLVLQNGPKPQLSNLKEQIIWNLLALYLIYQNISHNANLAILR